MKKFLPILMFLLIFSPKIGGTIDSMSMFCLLTFVLSFTIDNKLVFSREAIRPTLLYIFFGLFMVGYVTILKAVYGLADNYQIMRFGRVVVNVVGIFSLVRLYIHYYGSNYGRELLYSLWLSVVAHAALIAVMFFVPAVNQFVITQLVQMDEANRTFERRIEGTRIGGLTSTWDAASGVLSLGILLLPYIFNYRGAYQIRKIWIYLSIPLCLFAILLSGVTGIVNLFVVGTLIVILNFKRLKKYVFRTLTFLFLFVVVVSGILLTFFNDVNWAQKSWVTNTSIGRTIYMVTGEEQYYSMARRNPTANETIDKIGSKMYFLPEGDKKLLFGRGGSGRSSDYIIDGDPGITLNLHNLGIVFVIIVYSYCIFMVLSSVLQTRKDLVMGMAITAVLLTILTIDAKVMYLLARQSLSIMLIAYYSLFWLKSSKYNASIS
ncbi:hypothetical protein [Sphingobacterium sp. FBM7-1]|uniref:hypothetical protein n=1 Tax=Sphingobacterium sp. FBM7-1 TaxID=2886688 RepID=UPI001D122C75|nr:hypothetical protein [Sphingobacterium sp. FBM7-1]MCC2600005.1 hypothetical protein [Sphingobacterium sp. FBM7-1]